MSDVDEDEESDDCMKKFGFDFLSMKATMFMSYVLGYSQILTFVVV